MARLKLTQSAFRPCSWPQGPGKRGVGAEKRTAYAITACGLTRFSSQGEGERREMRGKGRRKDVSWGIKHRGGQRRRSVGRSVGRVLITLVHTRLALMTNVARGRARGCESPQWSGRGATPFHGGTRRRKKKNLQQIHEAYNTCYQDCNFIIIFDFD